jgi:hypothetical protein
MLKLRLLVLVAIASAIAAVGAGWKWHFHRVPAASTSYRIAGWTWGDGGTVSNEQQSHTKPEAQSSRSHS